MAQPKPLGKSLAAQLVISTSATTNSFDFPGKVVEISPRETVDSALRIMAKAGVNSAPVWDETAGKYLGFLDMLDLIAVAVDSVDLMTMLHSTPLTAGRQHSGLEDIPEDTTLKRQKTAVSHKTVGELFRDDEARVGQSQWHPVVEGTSFRKVLHLLAHKCRRVAVLSITTGRCVKIISQSAVVQMLYEHMRTQGEMVIETPGNTGWGIKPVFSVNEASVARDAFKMMVEHGISAVAVLDGAGKLLSTITTKDIRMLVSVEFAGHSMLDLSVREYISRIRARDVKFEARPAVIAAGLETSITNIIGKLAATKTHRVFVEDHAGKCVGVVSVTDVILLLERGNHFGPEDA